MKLEPPFRSQEERKNFMREARSALIDHVFGLVAKQYKYNYPSLLEKDEYVDIYEAYLIGKDFDYD